MNKIGIDYDLKKKIIRMCIFFDVGVTFWVYEDSNMLEFTFMKLFGDMDINVKVRLPLSQSEDYIIEKSHEAILNVLQRVAEERNSHYQTNYENRD